MKYKILILNGPNLNILGTRELQIYGTSTLEEINTSLIQIGKDNSVLVECFQSNSESELINKTQSTLHSKYDFIIINPAGFTHTSIAWRDALSAVNTPFIEVHLSNIFAREEFRHKSFFSDVAIAVISGLGDFGYQSALLFAINHIKSIYTQKNWSPDKAKNEADHK
ncbi:MAG: type II 3-dehydroquinate dehydratase [Proteobacteria bacterium]|jgi:3-dehydroquinate dehydratase-2|nr:type II 3-dehydroquinate dehydratase [Pseudomonadota bacterium]